jgi:hypothetical protein
MAIERRALIGLIVAFTASIVAFPNLPPDIPPRAGRDGAFIGAPFVAFLLPLAAMVIWWIVAQVGRRPPRATARTTNAGAATALFLSAFHVTMLIAFIGNQPWLVRVLGLLVGIFLIATGNDLPRVRPNLAWGVRMRQTLASDSLWRRVHRLAGFIRVAMGVVVCVVALSDSRDLPAAIVLAVCIETVACLAAGMLLARQRDANFGVQH